MLESDITQDPQKRIKAHPLFTVYLKEELVVDMWNKRNEFYNGNGNGLANTIYSVEKCGEPKINNYVELFLDQFSNYSFENDNLINLVCSFNATREEKRNGKPPFWIFWRDLHNSLGAFFDRN